MTGFCIGELKGWKGFYIEEHLSAPGSLRKSLITLKKECPEKLCFSEMVWTIRDLKRRFGAIKFPDYQREPNIWSRRAKQLLIDSVLRSVQRIS